MNKQGLAFHVYDALVEWCFGYNERLCEIESCAPHKERKLRKRLLQLIPEDKIPGRDSEEYVVYLETKTVYDRARTIYFGEWPALDKVNDAYDEALAAYDDDAEYAYYMALAAAYEAEPAYVDARAAFNEAGNAWKEAKRAFVKALIIYSNKFKKELEKLHTELCPDCPWDGKTLFPDKFQERTKSEG